MKKQKNGFSERPLNAIKFYVNQYLNVFATGNPWTETKTLWDKAMSQEGNFPEEKDDTDFTRIINLLKNMPQDDAQKLLELINTVLQFNLDGYTNSPVKEERDYQRLVYAKFVYAICNSYFHQAELGEQTYKTMLRIIFNRSIEDAEEIIEDDEQEWRDFGYEYKNNSLILRSMLRQVTVSGSDKKFLEEFTGLLSKEQKEFFFTEIIGGFVEKIFLDLYEGVEVSPEEYQCYCILQQNDFWR